MKRSHESGGDDKHPKAAKKDENLLSEPKDHLNGLPNEIFKILLTYLDNDDKKILKLASRNCERRIMDLDDSMRKWSITLCREGNSKKATDLMQSKARHKEDSNFHRIQLSVTFKVVKFFTSYFITNELNSNIVHLELNICGDEIYLLDPIIKLVRLKSLTLKNDCRENENDDGDCLPNLLKEFYEKNEAYYEENKAAIVYAIIKNHSDTLESLHLDELDVVIDFDLNLTSFHADNLYCDTIMSILKYSSKSLERFT